MYLKEPAWHGSEESDVDDNGDKIFTIRSLPWRSEKANKLFNTLDEKGEKKETQRSKQMKFKRIEGLPSDCPKPSIENIP